MILVQIGQKQEEGVTYVSVRLCDYTGILDLNIHSTLKPTVFS